MVFKFGKHKDDHRWLPLAYRKRVKEISGIISNKRISLRAKSTQNEQLCLELSYDSEFVCDLGIYRIEEGGEEKIKHLLFSRLCFHNFFRFSVDIELLMEVDVAPRSLKASIYNEALNKLFDAACHFHQYPDRETELKKLATEPLRIIRSEAADNLVRALAYHYTQILLKYGSKKINNEFNISYSSNLNGVWKVHCFCPLLSMMTEYHKKIPGFVYVWSHLLLWKREVQHKVSDLESTLRNHQLECRVELHPEVKSHDKSIEVEINIKNLCCGALPFELGLHEAVQMRPVRISVKVRPTEPSHLDGAKSGASSSNPIVNCSRSNTTEGGIGVGLTPGLNGQLNGKRTVSNTVSSLRKNWHFEASATNNREGSFQWTLYHHSYQGQPVYSYSPKSRSCSGKYKAFEGLLRAVGPTSPFTEGGAVEFAEDMYGAPIKWTFYKSARGKTFDWFVECEIWTAYYSTTCMEIRHQKFLDVFQLPMRRSHR